MRNEKCRFIQIEKSVYEIAKPENNIIKMKRSNYATSWTAIKFLSISAALFRSIYIFAVVPKISFAFFRIFTEAKKEKITFFFKGGEISRNSHA